MQASGAYLLHKLSYIRFCAENHKFPNVTGIVQLADPENHTIEPKIATLSYIQPELWQFEDFPIETMVIFFIEFSPKLS